jgi:hypothetical protein
MMRKDQGHRLKVEDHFTKIGLVPNPFFLSFEEMRNLKCYPLGSTVKKLATKSFYNLRTKNRFGIKIVKPFRFGIKPIKFNTKSDRFCIIPEWFVLARNGSQFLIQSLFSLHDSLKGFVAKVSTVYQSEEALQVSQTCRTLKRIRH